MNLVDQVEKDHANPNAKKFPAFKTGDTVEVAVRIKEGEKTQIDIQTQQLIKQAQQKVDNLTTLENKVNGFKGENVAEVLDLLQDAGIIRNKLKVYSAVTNAQAFIKIQEEFGSFSKYIWNFTGGKPIQNNRESLREVPSTTPLSDVISKDLKKRGFKFVGPTVVYAHMQATGMVDDHVANCWKKK